VIFVGQIIPEKGLTCCWMRGALRGRVTTLDVGDTTGGGAWLSWASGHARERAHRADSDGAVTFSAGEDVPALMSRASLHCCPSRPEQRRRSATWSRSQAVGLAVGSDAEWRAAGASSPTGAIGRVCARVDAETLAEGSPFSIDANEIVRRKGASLGGHI
jgi:hypothetical protein